MSYEYFDRLDKISRIRYLVKLKAVFLRECLYKLLEHYWKNDPSIDRLLFVAACGHRHRHYSKMAGIVGSLSMTKSRVAVCQMTATADKEMNFSICKALIEKAKSQSVQMVFLPECFDYVGESITQSLELSESLDGDLISKYKCIAKELQIWLSLGGFHQKNDLKTVKNTHILINSEGQIAGTYEKVHMFDFKEMRICESDYTSRGERITPPIPTPVGKIGLGICYDLRFPELSMVLTRQGAEILTYPSAFMEPTGMAHWESLLRSRAIENQCYVIAAAQVGKHNQKRSSYGHTMVIDPWGTVIAECSKGTGLCTAEIDAEFLQQVRSDMPVWHQRRPDLYGHVYALSKESTDIDQQPTYQFGHVNIGSKQVFLRTPLSFAVVNIKPVLPGHVLICPHSPVEKFCDLNNEQMADLWFTARNVGEVVKRHFGGTSLTFAVQDGKEAGQTIKHVHIHVIPRKAGDFFENDDIYKELQKSDMDKDQSKHRTVEETNTEANELRPYFM